VSDGIRSSGSSRGGEERGEELFIAVGTVRNVDPPCTFHLFFFGGGRGVIISMAMVVMLSDWLW